jgi:hypothetical protein
VYLGSRLIAVVDLLTNGMKFEKDWEIFLGMLLTPLQSEMCRTEEPQRPSSNIYPTLLAAFDTAHHK